MAKIYLASSWRNEQQPALVELLRAVGHEVYDFRNPPGKTGFGWQELDGEWKNWTANDYRENLTKPRAMEGFKSDFDAMKWADTCVLLLPCGRSAHLEAGWMAGAGKKVIVLTRDGEEPELMVGLCTALCTSVNELLCVLRDAYPLLPKSVCVERMQFQ